MAGRRFCDAWGLDAVDVPFEVSELLSCRSRRTRELRSFRALELGAAKVGTRIDPVCERWYQKRHERENEDPAGNVRT